MSMMFFFMSEKYFPAVSGIKIALTAGT